MSAIQHAMEDQAWGHRCEVADDKKFHYHPGIAAVLLVRDRVDLGLAILEDQEAQFYLFQQRSALNGLRSVAKGGVQLACGCFWHIF